LVDLGTVIDRNMTRTAHPAVRRLVIFVPNWLGDAVMALPAIADIRRAFDSASIAVAARASIAPLFRLVPGLDDIIVLPGRGGPWRSATLLRGRFDAAVLLTNSLQTALAAWQADIAERWGYRRELRGPLLTRGVPPPGEEHQVQYYQHLVRMLGLVTAPSAPRLLVSADLRAEGEQRLREEGWDGVAPLVALAPGAASGGAKRWPAASFGGVATALAADGVTCVFVGGAADRDAADEALEHATAASVIDLVGRTDLPQLAGVLVHCRAVVTNDSGAMHFAAAAGVPVTAMFGPTDERATRPLGDEHAVLTHPVWCRPCMLRECPLDHRCMTRITVDSVVASARRSL
jgi:heptosyltransferase-2